MEQEEDRQKKLAAGKEKLAAFRKKRAKKKKVRGDGGEGEKVETGTNSSCVEVSPVDVSSASDLNSLTGESDQFSLTSGEEWSAEESDLNSAVYLQTKLIAATQHIAELEELVEGKQLALDAMVQELQFSTSTMTCKPVEVKVALEQRDKIIQQLTNRLQETLVGMSNTSGTKIDSMLEAQQLSCQVASLQKQLSEACETVQNQATMCQISVDALQEAKNQILNLQIKVTEKNSLLQHLTQTLAETTAQILPLKAKELELEELVRNLQLQAAKESEARHAVAYAAQADADKVCLLEQQLEKIANEQEESTKAFALVQQQLKAAETKCLSLDMEKETAKERIILMEIELQSLMHSRDEAYTKLSSKTQTSSVFHASQGSELDLSCASSHELERENQGSGNELGTELLSQTTMDLGMLTERSLTSDMSDLKNKINSQQNEIMTLKLQLHSAEAENAFSRVQVKELEQQLGQLRKEFETEQESKASIVSKFELKVFDLQSENAEYIKKIETLEIQVNSFREELTVTSVSSSFPLPKDIQILSNVPMSEHLKEPLEDSSAVEQLSVLQNYYQELQRHHNEVLQHNHQLKAQLSDTCEKLTELQQLKSEESNLLSADEYSHSFIKKLQGEVETLASQVQEKDIAVANLQTKLDCEVQDKVKLQDKLQKYTESSEQLTLKSDTQRRKLETRISSLRAEMSEFKEALRESETANIELQEKLDSLTAEMENQKSILTTSENQTQSLWNLERSELQKELDQKDAHLQIAFEKQEQLLAAVREVEAKHEKEVKDWEVRLSDTMQRYHDLLEERQFLISAQTSDVSKLETNLKQKVEELENLLLEKEQYSAELASVQVANETEIQNVRKQLELKSEELLQLLSEKEHLTMRLACENANSSNLKMQLELRSQEITVMMAEKEESLKVLKFSEIEQRKNVEDLQEKLEQKSQEFLRAASAKEEIEAELTAMQSSVDKQLQDLNEKLVQRVQEYQIVSAENEVLQEQLRSDQSVISQLTARGHDLQILLDEKDRLESEVQSKDSALNRHFHTAQQALKKNQNELKELSSSYDRTLQELQWHLEQSLQQLATTQDVRDNLQHKEEELKAQSIHLQQLEHELASIKEEKEALASCLSSQAEMFRVKEEEMVAENNILNHQLEEVRNEAQKKLQQHQLDQQESQEKLHAFSVQLLAKEEEIKSIKDKISEHKNALEQNIASNKTLIKENDELVLEIQHLKASAEKAAEDYYIQIADWRAEVDRLKHAQEVCLLDFEKEKLLLVEKCDLLQEQAQSNYLEINQLQQSYADTVSEKESLIQQQKDFATELDHLQQLVIGKDAELVSARADLKNNTEQFASQLKASKEELALIQADLEHTNFILSSVREELATALMKVEETVEEKQMLKSNFDSCMEEMTQRLTEQEDTIQHLQSQSTEASQNVDRDHNRLQEMYEAQISEIEDRLALSTAQVQRLENIIEGFDIEKDKLRENYSNQIEDLEVCIQTTESKQIRLKEQMNKMSESHERELSSLKHTYESQLSIIEENCQALEKIISKHNAAMQEAHVKFENEKAERERNFEQQLSEAYEQGRMFEMDVSRLKRQMDEMNKDHKKEQQKLQKSLEIQIFDMENKYSIATSELERMRQSLWTMEGDFTLEKQALEEKVHTLERVCHSQEKQIADMEDKHLHFSHHAEENSSSLRESHNEQIMYLQEHSQQLVEQVQQLQEQLKAVRNTHNHEMQAIKLQHADDMKILQERHRQAEIHSQVLQSHFDSTVFPSPEMETLLLKGKIEELQNQLASAEPIDLDLQLQMEEAKVMYENKVKHLEKNAMDMKSQNEAANSEIKKLNQDLMNGQEQFQNVQIDIRNLEGSPSCLKDGIIQLSERQHLEKDFSDREIFHPEQDSLHYLDLAVNRGFFLDETDRGTEENRERAKSVPMEMFVTEALECEQFNIQTPFSQSQSKQKEFYILEASNSIGCFEPEEDNMQLYCANEGTFDDDNMSHATNRLTGCFQPEFLPQSLDTEFHDFLSQNRNYLSVCNHSQNSNYIPVCSSNFSTTGIRTGHHLDLTDSATQTDIKIVDTVNFLDANACYDSTNRQMRENLKTDCTELQVVQANHEPRTMGEETLAPKETVEKEISQRLKSLRDEIEEEWVQKLRSEQVKLSLDYDHERHEYQQQMEQQCLQRIEAVKREFQVAFVDTVRKMRRSLQQKQKQERHGSPSDRKGNKTGPKDSHPDAPLEMGDEELGERVKQLHFENQELAEVRDVLLEQIDISRTRGRLHTMQHELQAKICKRSKLSDPKSTTDCTSDYLTEKVSNIIGNGRSLSEVVDTPISSNCSNQVEEVFITPSNQLSEMFYAPESEAGIPSGMEQNDLPSNQIFALNSNDGSESSSLRECFLEELEEMSQQSGLDLPLEWELTSSSVNHTGTNMDGFERDQMGSGSIWEVFDGRCPRQDCREVRSRYYGMFRWLSRACYHETIPTDVDGMSSQAAGGHFDFEELEMQGEEDGLGSEVNDLLKSNIACSCEGLEFRKKLLDALFSSLSKITEFLQKDGSLEISDSEVFGYLLTMETEKSSLEQRLVEQLQLFKRERNELEHNAELSQVNCEALEKENTFLQEQFKTLEEQYKTSHNNESLLQEKCVFLDENCSLLQCNLLRLQEKVDMLQRSNSDLQAKLDKVTIDFDMESDRVQSLKESCQSLQENIDMLQRCNTDLQEKCAALQAKLDKVNMDFDMESNKAHSLKESCQSFQVKSELNQRENEMPTEKNSALEEKHKALQERCKDSEMASSNTLQTNYVLEEYHCPPLVSSASSHEGVHHLAEKATFPMENKCKLLQTVPERSIVLLEEDASLKERFESVRERLMLIHRDDESARLKVKCQVLEESNEILEEKYTILQKNFRSLKKECDLLQESNILLRGMCSTLQNENNNLHSKHSMSQESLESLRDKCSSLEKNNELLQQNCTSMQKKSESLQEECNSLQERNQSLHEACISFQRKCRHLQDICQLLTNQIKDQQGCNSECVQSHNCLNSLHLQDCSVKTNIQVCPAEKIAKTNTDPSLQLQAEELEINELGKHNASLIVDRSFESPERKWQFHGAQHLSETVFSKDHKHREIYLTTIHSSKLSDTADCNQDLKHQVLVLNEILTEQEYIISGLKEQVKLLGHNQEEIKSTVSTCEEAAIVKQQVVDLKNLMSSKEKKMKEFEELVNLPMRTHSQERKEIEQHCKGQEILLANINDKETIIAALKNKVLSLKQDKKETRECIEPCESICSSKEFWIDRQEKIVPEEDRKKIYLRLSDLHCKRIDNVSEYSVDSDSMIISSDPDSDVISGNEVDILKEIGRMRRDVQKTKAVYANESALLHEALEREKLNQSKVKCSKSPNISLDLTEMTVSDIPYNVDQLRRFVFKLLEENKVLTTENLRLQLRIREQEALVVEMEERLQSAVQPPQDWQSMFERQLLLLQKQRDELLHQICEREAGLELLSSKIGKVAVNEEALLHDKETLLEKVGELEHCHQVLQQRQAELAHCQAEKRHLEHLLLLKDETERQLMRQKRLLEEELSVIEGKLQERESVIVEEKARLMMELKKKDLRIFELQASQIQSQYCQGSTANSNKLGLKGPQLDMQQCRTSTPHRGVQFDSSHALDHHHLPSSVNASPHENHQNYLQEENNNCNQPVHQRSLEEEIDVFDQPSAATYDRFAVRRHSTGKLFSRRQLHLPADPEKLHRIHMYAVDQLREKLRLEDVKKALQNENPAASVAGYQHHL